MRAARLTMLVLLAGGGLAYLGFSRGLWTAAAPSAPRAAAAIPVSARAAARTDVPVEIAGLGTVQALNSVLVRSRVDGQIVKVNYSEGKDVHAGDVLVEIDPAPYQAALAQAQANKLKDQALLDNARLDLERYAKLVKSGATNAQQLDTQRSLVDQLDATVKSDQAAIDMAQVQLSYSYIRAPFDGKAGTRLVDVGNIVRATDTTGVVTINQIHPIFVDFALPSDSLPRIRTRAKGGDIGNIKVTALDAGGQELAVGKLDVIDNQINVATGTINYKAVFDNADETLWPGEFVNVRVELEVLHGVIAVPVTAVQYGPDGPYAFVVGPDRKVQKRAIKTGVVNKVSAVITSGLEAGDMVVTDGQYRIESGSTVEVLGKPAEG
ncbi:MAG TPA: efflux RND transporter periplasmic adaptor subunit [Xanthobacteraceae bacterium]|nr:efflux RND transporter periplasmic adaptor subunit [Xanthobacteraceae bacterium]